MENKEKIQKRLSNASTVIITIPILMLLISVSEYFTGGLDDAIKMSGIALSDLDVKFINFGIGLIIAISIIRVLIYAILGMRGHKQAEGKKTKSVHIVIAAIFAVFSVISLVTGVVDIVNGGIDINKIYNVLEPLIMAYFLISYTKNGMALKKLEKEETV